MVKGTPPARWWETAIGKLRLEYELQALELAGIRAEKDKQSFEKGIAKLIIYPPVKGDSSNPMYVTFPDTYPYFRFIVEARHLDLAHHQNPFAKTLCLIGRSNTEWRLKDTVAGLISEQLDALIDAGTTTDADEARGIEEQQAEPYSEYYTYEPSMVQINGDWVVPDDLESGYMLLAGISWIAHLERPPLQLIALELQDNEGKILGEVLPSVKQLYSQGSFLARWVRLPEKIASDNPDAIFDHAEALDPRSQRNTAGQFPVHNPRIHCKVYGILFPEETSVRVTEKKGWIFAIRLEGIEQAQAGNSAYMRNSQPSGRKRRRKLGTYLARAGRSGINDILERAPELSLLRGKTIAVFGAGCIGAPSVMEFAKAGVCNLRLLDDDIVDPATTIRWPFGYSVGGRHKVEVLNTTIQQQYPYTTVDCYFAHRIGRPRAEDKVMPEDVIMDHMLNGAHLIYDATADEGVQRYLSDLAYDLSIPYISVSGTQGGWGGTLLRIRPGKTKGCLLCYRLNPELPIPAAKAIDGIQPVGCANPTFTGSGFDMAELGMMGVRLAVSTLCDGIQGGYPDADWDIATISYRDLTGLSILPSITVGPLESFPGCPVCQERSGLAETSDT